MHGPILVPTAEELAYAEKWAHTSLVDVPDGNGGKKPLAVLCRANTDVSHREKNVAINIARALPRFLNRQDLMILRNEPIAIVGGGPSVRNHLDEIRKFKWVMAAGSSHDYLVENGIIPNFAVSTDAKDETINFYDRANPTTQYLMASVLPPALFDKLEAAGCNVQLWHFNEQVDPPHYRGERAIGWGCMVGVVCIQMALWLGFQEHHYFGYDCSLDRNAMESHAYPVSDEERLGILDSVTEASVGEEETKFLTTTALICQATHFFGVYQCPDGNYLKGYVYGRGLLHDQIRQSPPEIKQWLEAV